MSGRKYMDYEVEGIKTKGREGGGMNLNGVPAKFLR